MWLLQVAIPAHVLLFLWPPAWEEVSVYQELAAGSSYLLTLSPPLATRINELLGLRCHHHAPQLRDCIGRTSGEALHFTDEGKWGQKGRAATGLLCHWDQVQGVGRKQQSWARGSGVSAMKASLGVGGLGTACTAKLSREDKQALEAPGIMVPGITELGTGCWEHRERNHSSPAEQSPRASGKSPQNTRSMGLVSSRHMGHKAFHAEKRQHPKVR